MFRLTSKVKIAAGLAAGALTLGAAGAYAAANANNTITVTPAPITVGSGSNQLKLIGINGTTAQNKNIALAPPGASTGSVKLSKNYHGKLMSSANAWCKTQVSSAAKTDSTQTETPATTDAADATDSTTPPSHGQGHGYGHAKHTN